MFLTNYFKKKKHIILGALISFLLLESISFLYVLYIKQNDMQNYLKVVTYDAKKNIDTANAYLTDISKIFYDISINRPEIIEIMYEASKTKDEQQHKLQREKLLQKLTATYTYMQKYNIRQLHFQLPNAVSFLRFNKPNKYSDSLINIRETLKYVNKYRTPISTFEAGRIFNGFRNVYPLYKNNEFLGTVEISFSFNAMLTILSKFDHSSYLFMIKKQIVNKKVFQEEQSNYTKSEFKSFCYDKQTLQDTMQISLTNITKINNKIKDDINKKLTLNKPFSIYYHDKQLYNNNSIMINFFPVSNLNNKVVAYIIHYSFGDFIDIILKNMVFSFWILTLLSLLLTSIFTIVLIHEKKKQDTMHTLSVHDALTGIYNRHGINEILNQKLEEYKRDNKELSVIFFDIDFFKRVNDTYGHDIGDFVLENIAKVVNSGIRASDIFARWGGEEFILFLPDTDIKSAIKLAEKLRKSIQEYVFNHIDQITCSFGVTLLMPQDTKTSFLKRADNLLYKAKKSGRNCVVSDSKQ